VAALNAACKAIFCDGLKETFARHETIAKECREGLERIGVKLFTRPEAVNSPTITAAMMPEKFTWPEWKKSLRDRGLVISGSFGPMANKVFRLGHMGMQADSGLMVKALDVIEDALR
jgi:aspartate aminotransferase-like enzyme